jgi:hypothetical protein
MFYLFGYKKVLHTQLVLCKAGVGGNIDTIEDVKKSYLTLLESLHPAVWHPQYNDSIFINEEEIIKKLTKSFRVNSVLTDMDGHLLDQYDQESFGVALSRIQEALEEIKIVDSMLYDVFCLIINTIFYARSDHEAGGSVSTAIGVIWASNKKSWSVLDVIEFLVHEFTHNLVFLDELRYRHYINASALSDSDYFAKSTILNKKRPLDKAFHSFIVAIEILLLRKKFGTFYSDVKVTVHPESRSLLKSCMATQENIRQLLNQYPTQLVTERFKLVFDHASDVLDALIFESQ